MPTSYIAIVDQAISLLEGLSDGDYQTLIKPYFSSSIGTHIRHIIDHYLALKDGLDTGHINYNVRHRHSQAEQFIEIATKALVEIKAWLASLDQSKFSLPIMVTTEIDISYTKSAKCASTFERELVFVSSHAIHHYALIRVICAMQNKTIPDIFGFAPATITHSQNAS